MYTIIHHVHDVHCVCVDELCMCIHCIYVHVCTCIYIVHVHSHISAAVLICLHTCIYVVQGEGYVGRNIQVLENARNKHF